MQKIKRIEEVLKQAERRKSDTQHIQNLQRAKYTLRRMQTTQFDHHKINTLQIRNLIEKKYQSQIEEVREKEEKWDRMEAEIKKMGLKKIKAANQIDQLAILLAMFALFFLTIYFAPNQFYIPRQ